MKKSFMSKAEELFSVREKKTQQLQDEKETAELKRIEKTSRLKALRYEKERAEK